DRPDRKGPEADARAGGAGRVRADGPVAGLGRGRRQEVQRRVQGGPGPWRPAVRHQRGADRRAVFQVTDRVICGIWSPKRSADASTTLANALRALAAPLT